MSFLSSLVERAQSFLGVEREPVETQAVEADRFDHAAWEDVRSQVPPLQNMITQLSKDYSYVEDFMEDLFQSAFKAAPELRDSAEMKPSHLPNHAMIGELQDIQQFQQLRSHTRGDEYGSMMALLAMEPAIRQSQAAMVEAKKRAEEAQKAAEEAAQQAQQIEECLPGGTGPLTQQQAEALAQAQQQAANARQQAQQAAQQSAQGVKDQLRIAAQKAADERAGEDDLMSAFGVDDGELKRMPFEERRELAQKLRNNRLAKFTKLLGQFRMIQQSESRRKTMHASDEVVGVRLGDNLQRLIPAEMINLATPELEDDFWLRWANHELLEYVLRGKEKLGQGPIICVVDESGSMSATDVMGGSREAWSKALSLALCDQARQKGRDFIYIGFSSTRQQWTQRFIGGKTTIAGVIEMTEHFFDGGTHYETPLRQALEIVEQQYDEAGKPKPDIVFITDDEYGSLDSDFMHEWNRVKDKVDIRCFGVALGCGFSGALQQVSDNVRSITDLTESDPRAMADIFRVV